jgi:hypothetical protein
MGQIKPRGVPRGASIATGPTGPLTTRPIPRPKPTQQVAPGFNPPSAPQPSWLTPEQILAQAQALAASQQAPAYQSIQDQQGYAQQVLAAQQARNAAIYAALQGVLGGVGPAANQAWQQGAQTQSAFGKGFAHGMELVTQGSADKTNAYLQNVVGAPQGQQIPGSQSRNAADVLNAIGGAIPAEQMHQMGIAAGNYAAAYPAQAQSQQQLADYQAHADYQTQSNAFAQQLQQLERQQPGVIAQFLNDLYTMQQNEQTTFFNRQEQLKQDASSAQQAASSAKQAAESRAMSLFNSGLITQRQLGQTLNLPGWKKLPNQTKGQLDAAAKGPSLKYYKDGAGNNWVLDETTGKTQMLPGEAKTVAPKSLQQGGYIWNQNPDGTWSVAGGTGPTASSSTQPTNTGPFYHNPNTGAWDLKPGYVYGPNGTVVSKSKTKAQKQQIMGAGGVPMTNAEINSAAADVKTTIFGKGYGGKRPIASVIRAVTAENIPESIWVPIVSKAYNIPTTTKDLRYMNVTRLHNLAVMLGYQPPTGGSKGLDKAGLVQWIQAHLPKASAPAQTGANGLVPPVRSEFYTPTTKTAPGGFNVSAAASPDGAKQAAFTIASQQYGWTGADLKALDTLWNNESSWDYTAKNPSSGALGIPQALGHSLPPGYATDPIAQIRWGLKYIKDRYGSPSRALAFWYSKKPANLPQGHWY